MSIPNALIVVCFLALMGLGAFVIVYSVLRLTKKKSAPSQLSLPGLKIDVKGPAWLVFAVVGALMIASPIIAAEFQRPNNVTTPPPPASVQHVLSIPDPSYAAFRFVRDVSVLDLRSSNKASWYMRLPGWRLIDKKPRIRPAVLRNYMIVRKITAANEIHITYGTSGRLDVRCITHAARYSVSEKTEGDSQTEAWEVIADVSAVPVGAEFEIMIEATYWNAFSGQDGDNYTTYAHNQTEAESLSVMLMFPDQKPYKTVSITEYNPINQAGSALETGAQEWHGAQNQTYYWNVSNTRPDWYYKIVWTW